MRRLYFLTPTIQSARQIVDELLLTRIDSRHIHIISDNEPELARAHLPEATLLEKTDVVPAFERGIVFGFLTGLVAGALAITFPPSGLELGGGAFLGITLAGAAFGAWISGMIGVSLHNSQLKAFESAIAHGGLLIIIDVPKDRVDEITRMVKNHHPEAKSGGEEPTMPAFP